MANKLLYANNASTILAGSITNTDTSLAVSSGTGVLFPSPSGAQAFYITLTDAATGLVQEIMLCTSRSGDTLTVVRGQQGTSAVAWNAGDLVAQFVTAGDMAGFQQSAIAIGNLTGPPQVYSATSGSLAFPTGTNKIFVQLMGAGGPGGNAATTAGGQWAICSGGGGGAFLEAYITANFVGASLSIGAAGTGTTPGGATVLTLTDSTAYTAPGGHAGAAGAAVTTPEVSGAVRATAQASGGAGTMVNTAGEWSASGFGFAINSILSGQGGAHPSFGTGGAPSDGTVASSPGQGFGAGGGGGASTNGGTAFTGGAGTGGYAIIWPLT